MPEMDLTGFPFGRLMAVYTAVKNGRAPNAEDVAAIDAWHEGRPPSPPRPALRQTHTYVELGLSSAAYDEIATKLKEAGYDHAFVDGAIDMHGLAVTKEQV